MLSCGLASKGVRLRTDRQPHRGISPILAQKRCDGLRLPVSNGTVVAVSRALTLDPPRMIERLSISGSRGHGEYERRQRLYRAEELGAALEHIGFSPSEAQPLAQMPTGRARCPQARRSALPVSPSPPDLASCVLRGDAYGR
jgi:hypothetical protein